ncbi:MAG: asparagine synthase (glutamine-hydrolyzing) [Coriobacteriales bacterium]|nr:asparagine synthase (glutamine-hydrolyzing) [Coriobacteriales bacterium]
MCGFVGFTSDITDKDSILEKMMQRIVHRGPDMGSTYSDESLALGFRRLSIIDLSEAGLQPMTNSVEDSSVVVVFNGEIYNFAALRGTLEQAGHRFASNTDTEVLLHGYEHYGTGLTDHLRGMFAFVIYDRQAQRLFGARDFFGIKPFYYTRLCDGSLLFGSEIKAFLDHPLFVPQVNEQALVPYLTFQYSALPETFFKGVFKLPQAHRFCYDIPSGKMSIERFWDARFKPEHRPFDKAVTSLDQAINESVDAHRIADVPVGTFLSGGIDSSYITSAMRPQKTFSVGFVDEGFSEVSYAKELSDILRITNYSELIDPTEALEVFPQIVYHLDEPDSNPSVVPLYFLAKLAAREVTVVLSGEGGDELFAGYDWYADPPRARGYKRLPSWLRRAVAAVAGRLPYFKGQGVLLRSSGRPEDYFYGQAVVFEEKDARALLKPAYQNGPSPRSVTAPIYARVQDGDELTKKQYLDLNLWQPGDILLKADKMSMAHSLELRVPFLDRVVFDEAATIPADYKIKADTTKYILRQAAAKTIPPQWANRVKLGFLTPVRNWLRRKDFYATVGSSFASSAAAEFFDQDQLHTLLDDHYYGRANNARKIWTVFTFLTWHKRFFIDEVGEKDGPHSGQTPSHARPEASREAIHD